MSAVAYLASYLSRANFLSAPSVAGMLKRLVDWSLEYCKTKGGEMNPTSHRLFYSACQVCLPSIIDEFCRQAEAACLFTSSKEFVFNYSLESEHSRAFGGMERLDIFFPFDPCLLKKNDRYIQPHFVYWSMVRPPYDDDDEAIIDKDVVEQELGLDVSKMSMTLGNSMAYWIQGGFEEPRGMPARIRPSTSPKSL